MKRLLLLLFFSSLTLVCFSGCQSSSLSKSGVDVFIEGGGEFPQSLVGTWRANEGSWEIVFEPDGAISSAVINLSGIRMKPGEITTVPMRLGGKGIYEPGQWLVHYAPANRELTVKIILKNFHAELGNDILEGKGTDVFVGKVSEDGKVWLVDWSSFPDYTAHTAEIPNFRMYEDPNDVVPKPLVFEKIAPE